MEVERARGGDILPPEPSPDILNDWVAEFGGNPHSRDPATNCKECDALHTRWADQGVTAGSTDRRGTFVPKATDSTQKPSNAFTYSPRLGYIAMMVLRLSRDGPSTGFREPHFSWSSWSAML